MITFCVQAHNGNYYRGHEPKNGFGNCWADSGSDALVFTIEQARELVAAWRGYLNIVIAVSSVPPLTDEQFKHELFCARGGTWYGYKRPCDPPCDGPCADCEGRKRVEEVTCG